VLANITEAAKLLDVNRFRLYHMVRRRELRAKKVGNKVLIDIEKTRAIIAALDGLKQKRGG
jgi:excisionase family DNA binding protein